MVTIPISLGQLEPESATPERRDDEAPDDVGRIRLVMAGAAKGDQTLAVDV